MTDQALKALAIFEHLHVVNVAVCVRLLTKNGIELSWMHMPAYFTQWSFRSAYLPFLESKLGRGISFPWCVNSKMAASLQVTKSVHFLLLKS